MTINLPNKFPVWAAIPGWEGMYYVSSSGLVWSDRSQKVLTPIWCGRVGGKYATVALQTKGGRVCRKVHQLVLEVFVGPRPDGAVGRHLDDDKTNNNLANLCWGTLAQNSHDSVMNGTHPMCKLTHSQRLEIKNRRSAGESPTSLAREYGVTPHHVYQIVIGRVKTISCLEKII